VTEQWIFIFI